MRELVETHNEAVRFSMFEMGIAVNAAMSTNPQKALDRILNPLPEMSVDDLHPMIRGSIRKV